MSFAVAKWFSKSRSSLSYSILCIDNFFSSVNIYLIHINGHLIIIYLCKHNAVKGKFLHNSFNFVDEFSTVIPKASRNGAFFISHLILALLLSTTRTEILLENLP